MDARFSAISRHFRIKTTPYYTSMQVSRHCTWRSPLQVLTLSETASFMLNLCMKAADTNVFDPILIREAQTHLDHAKLLDGENEVTQAFLDKVHYLFVPKGKG